jgi:rod shape-determining protein MreC
MGVISSLGVIGIVKTTSNHFATIIPVINTNAHISARIKSNKFFGTTSWNGVNPSYINLSDIPYHVKLKINDTIITSGFSSIFPEGIMIGKITHFDYNQGNDFYNIDIKLSPEFGQLDFVYVVNNKLQPEYQQLQKTIKNAE